MKYACQLGILHHLIPFGERGKRTKPPRLRLGKDVIDVDSSTHGVKILGNDDLLPQVVYTKLNSYRLGKWGRRGAKKTEKLNLGEEAIPSPPTCWVLSTRERQLQCHGLWLLPRNPSSRVRSSKFRMKSLFDRPCC